MAKPTKAQVRVLTIVANGDGFTLDGRSVRTLTILQDRGLIFFSRRSICGRCGRRRYSITCKCTSPYTATAINARLTPAGKELVAKG